MSYTPASSSGSATVLVPTFTPSVTAPWGLPGWLSTGNAQRATGFATAVDRIWFTPIVLGRSLTIDRLGLTVTTAATGAVIRMGVYSGSATTGAPSALLLDAGTVPASATGSLESVVSLTLAPGIYYLATVTNNASVVCTYPGTGAIAPIAGAGTTGTPESLVYVLRTIVVASSAANGLPASAGATDINNAGYERAWPRLRAA